MEEYKKSLADQSKIAGEDDRPSLAPITRQDNEVGTNFDTVTDDAIDRVTEASRAMPEAAKRRRPPARDRLLQAVLDNSVLPPRR
jgi:acyl-CoA reductase-like NAD-dependent aldehyde dehydrogenase